MVGIWESNAVQRSDMLDRARDRRPWDVVVIGGGATGLGTAVDAASRGYRTLLLEAHDFAQGTSSRSTKLIHGGVRYLAQGRVGLVREALHERGILRRNAPHIVHDREFLIPSDSRWGKPYYGFGMTLYDLLAGRERWGWSRSASAREALERAPTLQPLGLRGGIIYHDGQFDDAALAIALLTTFGRLGGTALNYTPVRDIVHREGRIRGVIARDAETGEDLAINALAVVNATGVFADQVRRLDDPSSPTMIAPSQGVHLVLDREFLPGETAILIPKTDDGRVLFAIPWLGKVVVGTTDTPVAVPTIEPRPLPAEVEFLLDHVHRYLGRRPNPSDVRSVFAGLRPLIGSGGGKTSGLSRGHAIVVAPSGMITVTGGKWTTYRVMARDAVDRAATVAGLPSRPCVTDRLPLESESPGAPVELIHPRLPIGRSDVIRAVREEFARTIEDVLARRSRSLLLDAEAASEVAGSVAEIMAGEFGFDGTWIQRQIRSFRTLAAGYRLEGKS